MLLSGDSTVQFTKPLLPMVLPSMRAAGEFIARTARAAVGETAPAARAPYLILVSAPGDPPYKRRGALMRRITASYAANAVYVAVASYGLELGKGLRPRPHLRPVWELNKAMAVAIATGRQRAPTVGVVPRRSRPPQLRRARGGNGRKVIPGWNRGR